MRERQCNPADLPKNVKIVEVDQKKYRLAPGTVVQASDGQYMVMESGAWRRLAKHEETKGIVDVQRPPFHIAGRRPEDGAKCWCAECLRWWKGEKHE